MKFFSFSFLLFILSAMWHAPAYINSDNNKNKLELQQYINKLNEKLLYEKNKNKIIIKQLNEEREHWSILKNYYEKQIYLLNRLSLS